MLDRIVARILALERTGQDAEVIATKGSSGGGVAQRRDIDVSTPVPVHLLLTMLGLAVRQPAAQSVEKLFRLAQLVGEVSV